MSRYASDTTVPVDRSQAEIGRTLKRYDVTQFAFGQAPGHAFVDFTVHGWRVRFVIALPDPADRAYTRTPATGRTRTAEAAKKAYEQDERQRWRALNLLIKAKLEAVEAKVQTFEDEFLGYIVLPDGSTVAEHVRGPVAQAYATGEMTPLLPASLRAIGA